MNSMFRVQFKQSKMQKLLQKYINVNLSTPGCKRFLFYRNTETCYSNKSMPEFNNRANNQTLVLPKLNCFVHKSKQFIPSSSSGENYKEKNRKLNININLKTDRSLQGNMTYISISTQIIGDSRGGL